MIYLNTLIQLPYTKKVDFKVMTILLGDSYEQRRTSEKTTVNYSVTTAPIDNSKFDKFKAELERENDIALQLNVIDGTQTFTVLSYQFEKISTRTFVIKLELKEINAMPCEPLRQKLYAYTNYHKTVLTEVSNFINRFKQDSKPFVVDTDLYPTRFFEITDAITVHKQKLDFDFTTSKDYYLACETLLDLQTFLNEDKSTIYFSNLYAKTHRVTHLIFANVPRPFINDPDPFALPRSVYLRKDDPVTLQHANQKPEDRTSGNLSESINFVNGSYTFPDSIRLYDVSKVFEGTLISNYLDSGVDGKEYEIEFFVDYRGRFERRSEGDRYFTNTPINTIILKEKVTKTLKVNYIQTTETAQFNRLPLHIPVIKSFVNSVDDYEELNYYWYTSYFMLNFFTRIKNLFNTAVTKQILRCTEYSLKALSNSIDTRPLAYTPGIVPTYANIKNAKKDGGVNRKITWYGLIYLFEQNENYYRLKGNSQVEIENILTLKLTALQNYSSRFVPSDDAATDPSDYSWVFTPIFTL